MTEVIDDIQRRLKGVCRGDKERFFLKTRYIERLTVATASLQAECLTSLCGTLSTTG